MKCYAKDVIEIARAEVGYLEKKSNKNLDSKTANAGDGNYTKYARDLDKISGFYNGKKNGYAWCDMFVDWCFVKAFGVESAKELLCHGTSGAGCYYSMNYYKKQGRLYFSPVVGDQIFFKNANGGITHTGLVYKVDDDFVYTVEGNTSGASGVIPNGGGVCEKKYTLTHELIAGYGRPAYDEPEKAYVPTVLEWQKAAVKDGFDFPKYGTDGEWGKECEAVAKKAICKYRILNYKYKNLVKIIQKVVGADPDGKFGTGTKKAVIAYQKANGLYADGIVGLDTWEVILNVN